MAKRNPMRIAWSHDFQTYVATDPTRVNLCEVGTNKSKVMQRMRQAQQAYDANAAIYHGDVDGDCELA